MQCNIDSMGRKIRGINAVVLLLVALLAWMIQWPAWIVIVSLVCGLFAGFEALKGWCVLRALGIKTKF